MNQKLIIDIETAPIEEAILRVFPFDDAAEFDPSTVSVQARWKEETKQKYISEARERWNAVTPEERLQEHITSKMTSEKALLKPHFSKVGGFCYAGPDGCGVTVGNDVETEKIMLTMLAEMVRDCAMANGRILGWNVAGFDLPFIEARCDVHGIDMIDLRSGGRYYGETVIDLMAKYSGPGNDKNEKLKYVAVALGLMSRCPGEGKHWWKYDDGRKREYSQWDLEATIAMAKHMGEWE